MSHPLEWLSSRRQEKKKISKNIDLWENTYYWWKFMENSIEVPQKIKNGTTTL